MNKKVVVACCIGLGLYIGCSLWPHHSEFDDKATLEDVMERNTFQILLLIVMVILAIRLLLNLKRYPLNSLLTV